MLEYRLNKFMVIAITLIGLMPFVFYFLDGKFYGSISAMVDSPYKSLFYMFIFGGAYSIFMYGLKDDPNKLGNYQVNNKWFELVSAFALLGVGLFHYVTYSFWHFLFAGIFFLSIYINIFIFSSPKQRLIKFLVANLIPLGLLAHYLGFCSLLFSESLGILIYSVNIYLESKKLID